MRGETSPVNRRSKREFLQTCACAAVSGLYFTGFPFSARCGGVGNASPGSRRTGDSRSVSATGKERTSISPACAHDPLQTDFEPAYLALHRSGELTRRADELSSVLERCRLCPRECGAKRLAGERGFCGADARLEVSSYHPHFGEEKPLVGTGGSGTIFLTNCGLRCVFCINWEVSWEGEGAPRTPEDMAGMMLNLQKMKCHNINLVTPTHYSPHILRALDVAAGKGLRLPVVYNTSGFERLEIVRMLDGVVDIYLPDFKYWDGGNAAKYSSGAERYPEFARAAILEMNRQVGAAKPAAGGVMRRGLMIRHLVLPNRVAGTREIVRWIAANLPKDTYLNIMSQYRPLYRAKEFDAISRKVSRGEYSEAVRWAREAGLTNLDVQGYPLL